MFLIIVPESYIVQHIVAFIGVHMYLAKPNLHIKQKQHPRSQLALLPRFIHCSAAYRHDNKLFGRENEECTKKKCTQKLI